MELKRTGKAISDLARLHGFLALANKLERGRGARAPMLFTPTPGASGMGETLKPATKFALRVWRNGEH
jgi:hypothetical protein